MGFTGTLGGLLSRLANIVLGFGARRNVTGTGRLTLQAPTMSGTGTVTPPRYPLVQSTAPATGGASTAVSFATLPHGGNFILVLAASSKDPTGMTCADNQGNTYINAVQSPGAFTGTCIVFFAYNIGAPVGTFTVTVTDVGAANTTLVVQEYSGFGTNNPLYATGTSGLNFPVSIPTAVPATVNPNALGAAMVRTQLGQICTINNNTTVPAWEIILGQTSTTGAVRQIKTAGTQSITWASGNNMNSCIAIFQDPSDFAAPRVTQEVQSQIVQYSAQPRVTQIAQQQTVLFLPQPRVTQICLTIIVTNTDECPERPTIAGVEDGGDVPAASPAAPVICDNPEAKPIISAAVEGDPVAVEAAPAADACDEPWNKPTITGFQ